MSEIYIAQSSAVAARSLGDDMMIMSAADSTLFSLNAVAACIWQAADGCTPLSQIVAQKVCALFDVDLDTAYRDALELVEALARHGILTISDRSAEHTVPAGASR